MSQDGETATEGRRITAYAVYYFTSREEEADGQTGGLRVLWTLSEDLLNPNACRYCRRHQIDGDCPGLRAHATHALDRYGHLIPGRDKEIGMFDVPRGLTGPQLTAEIRRQISESEPHGLAS